MKIPHFALPEIYDDSLSYYDVLRKLIKSMHVINDNLNKIPEQIANEAKARLLGDQGLQTNIDNEAMARQEADNELRELISTSGSGITESQLNEEVTARQQADTALQTNIDNEATARTNADNSLQEKINTNKNDISELKGDLANKLPKSPADWEPWTDEEQAVARDRIGIPGGYELIVDVPTLETASNFHINLDSNGNSLALKAVAIDFAGAADGGKCLIEINNGYMRFTASLAEGRLGSFVGVPLGNDYYFYCFTNSSASLNQPNGNTNNFIAGIKTGTIINDIWFRGTVPAGASIQIYGVRG